MAPTKRGLDYFKYSLGLLKDRKFRPAKMKFGAAASVVYLALLELIYSDKGYYVGYDDNLVWDVQEYLQGAYCPNADTVREIIETLVACGLFDGGQFKGKILTSKRAQMEYYTSTVERKAVEIDFSIWLLSESEMKAISGKSIILHNFANRPNSAANLANSEDNQPNSRQSTVEYSTVKYSTVEDREQAEIGPAPPPPEWIDKLPITLTAHAKKELAGFLAQGLTQALAEWAAGVTAEKKAGWDYMKAILEDKIRLGIRDVSQLPRRKSRGAGSGFAASYDIEAFEQQGFSLPEGWENGQGD